MSSVFDFIGSNSGLIETGLKVGGSLLAGGITSSAAEKAAGAQTQASGEAIREQARQFDITQANLSPFVDAGTRAIVQQQAGTGLLGPGAQAQFFQDFQDSPGQDFLRDQQERALLRNASATGQLGGGNVKTALQEQAASRAALDFNNQLNRLAAVSGTGQTAGINLGQLGATTASNIGNLQVQGGQARASGILGAAQGSAQGLGGAIQGLGGLF